MKLARIILILLLGAIIGIAGTIGYHHFGRSQTIRALPLPADRNRPLTIMVVPTSQGNIEIQEEGAAAETPEVFYVILTNTSTYPVSAWETWNSWGYRTFSFEITGPDGERHSVREREDVAWGRNFPAFISIPPGGQQIFPMRLDKEWINRPQYPERDTKITFKAIYEVHEDDDSKGHNVWAGRIESKAYSFVLSRR